MTATKETRDVQAIKALIQAFFDRINDSDPRGLQRLFIPKANLTIMRQDPARDPLSDSMWSQLPLPELALRQTPAYNNDEENITVLLRVTIEAFVDMLEDGEKKRKGKPGPILHEAPDLNATEVKVDSLLASAWSPFRVTFDGTLHHYGTFVYTFGEVGDRHGGRVWKIANLTQSYRRTEGWEIEEEFGTESI